MRSFDITLLAHHEEHPSWWRPRHPIVVYCHLPFLVVLAGIYAGSAMTLGQTLTFLVMGGLYVSSAAYHTWRPSVLLRIIDQTMIRWLIVSTPLPWLYQEEWFQTLWIILLSGTAISAWYQGEHRLGLEKLTFMALGVLSTLLVFAVGLPLHGEATFGQTGLLVWLTIALYLAKLLVYHRQPKPVPGYLEGPEIGHWFCGMATTVFALVAAGVQ